MNRLIPIPLLATLVACGPSISTSGDKSLLPGAATYTWGAPLAPPAGQPEPAEASVRLRGRIQEAMEHELGEQPTNFRDRQRDQCWAPFFTIVRFRARTALALITASIA